MVWCTAQETHNPASAPDPLWSLQCVKESKEEAAARVLKGLHEVGDQLVEEEGHTNSYLVSLVEATTPLVKGFQVINPC